MTRTADLEIIRENYLKFYVISSTYNESFLEHYDQVYKGGVINEKTKRLIALCGGIVSGCTGCILGQTEHAINHGASVEEILEVCTISLSLGGTMAGSNMAIVIELLKEKGLVE